MEKLKPLNQITLPDDRSRYRSITLAGLHEILAEITLNATVPEHVQNQFVIARNALLYSWFFYPFMAVAEFYSILAIELALQTRVKDANPKMFSGVREPTLFPLLLYAIEARWLTDQEFDVEVTDDFVLPEKIAKQFSNVPHEQRYCYGLLDWLVSIRNDLAHGEFALAPGVSHSLARAAELINQLFPNAPTPSARA